MARSAYASFVKAYAERHAGLKGPALFRQAGHAWKAEKKNPIPANVLARQANPTAAQVEALRRKSDAAYKRYEKVPTARNRAASTIAFHKYEEARKKERRNPEVDLTPGEVLVLYPHGLTHEAEIEIPKGVLVQHLPEGEVFETTGMATNPRRRGINPTATCPECGAHLHVPHGATEGWCPSCHAHLRIA